MGSAVSKVGVKRRAGDDSQRSTHRTVRGSRISVAMTKHKSEADELLNILEHESPLKALGLQVHATELEHAIFVGHLTPDMDSIGGAIGAAHVYGGTATRPGPLNAETEFVLGLWGVDPPPPVEDLLSADASRPICLVDHNQTSQMHPAVIAASNRIAGCIDHHALQDATMQTEGPIYVDVRPWGSMSTIIAHTAFALNVKLPKPIAGCLLCAILSDTLNLRSPTTTEWDCKMLTVLAQLCDVKDVDELAGRQFRAKSKELASVSDHALVAGDLKTFNFTPPEGSAAGMFRGAVGMSVIETTHTASILEREKDLLVEMRQTRRDEQLAALLLYVVDIVQLSSTLLVCGSTEAALALAAYVDASAGSDGGSASGMPPPGSVEDIVSRGHMEMAPSMVSRKKDFLPPISRLLKKGWMPPTELPEESPLPREALVSSANFNGNLVRVSAAQKVETQRRGSYILARPPGFESMGLQAGDAAGFASRRASA